MLLSIIIPCYNSAKFINETLNMLLSQNLTDCEVICVNDGSVDNTLDILETYKSKYQEIKVYTQDNKGVSVARNEGLSHASGEFVYFLDSDDTLTDGTLYFFKNKIVENKECDFIGVGYESRGSLQRSYISEDFNNKIFDNNLLKKSYLSKLLFLNICSCIFNRKTLVNNSINFSVGKKIGEDVEFILKVMSKTERFIYFSRVCFIYQISDTGAMQGYKSFSDKLVEAYNLWKAQLVEFMNKDPELDVYIYSFLKFVLASSYLKYLKSSIKDINITKFYLDEITFLKNSRGCTLKGKKKLQVIIFYLMPLKLILKLKK